VITPTRRLIISAVLPGSPVTGPADSPYLVARVA